MIRAVQVLLDPKKKKLGVNALNRFPFACEELSQTDFLKYMKDQLVWLSTTYSAAEESYDRPFGDRFFCTDFCAGEVSFKGRSLAEVEWKE